MNTGRMQMIKNYSHLPQNTYTSANGLNNSGTLPKWLYRGYTGHEHLDEFALINMNARLYDPLVGMFLSPDNYIQAPGNTQNYNRYAYCLNNPLKYSDPSGNVAVADDIVAAAIGGVCNVAGNWNNITNANRPWLTGLGYFGIGPVGGWVGLYTAGAGGGAIIALGNGLMQQQNAKSIGTNMAIGAVTGLVTYGISSAMGSWAPNYDQISNLAIRYSAKAGYSFLSGYIGGASTNLTYQWLGGEFDYTNINFNSVHRAGLAGGAIAGSISLGFSAYDYATWDRFDGPQKVEMLNKKYNRNFEYMKEEDYYGDDPYDQICGFTLKNGRSFYTDLGLRSKNIAWMTNQHEFEHQRQIAHRLNPKTKSNEALAHWAENSEVYGTTPARYINNTNKMIHGYGYDYSVGRVRFSNSLFNIIR